MDFNPAKVWLMAFAILFKIHSAYSAGVLDMDKFREDIVKEADEATKKNKSEFSRGYGGKFGLESDQKDNEKANENVKKQ